MTRNILLSFLIHLLVLIATGLFYTMGNNGVFLVSLLVTALLGYAALGFCLLVPGRSALANLVSVSLVSAVGLLIGLYCWLYPGLMGFNWMVFLAYHLYGFGLAQALRFDPDVQHTLWFFVLPSLSLWAGLQARVCMKHAEARSAKS